MRGRVVLRIRAQAHFENELQDLRHGLCEGELAVDDVETVRIHSFRSLRGSNPGIGSSERPATQAECPITEISRHGLLNRGSGIR